MNRHEGVCCDFCEVKNFPGTRYKCLECFDFDLCETCYKAAATKGQHRVDHSMQRMDLRDTETRVKFEVDPPKVEIFPYIFFCPYCGKMLCSDAALLEHTLLHHDQISTSLVMCPVCAVLSNESPTGNCNARVFDFVEHLMVHHGTRLEPEMREAQEIFTERFSPTILSTVAKPSDVTMVDNDAISSLMTKVGATSSQSNNQDSDEHLYGNYFLSRHRTDGFQTFSIQSGDRVMRSHVITTSTPAAHSNSLCSPHLEEQSGDSSDYTE